MADWPHQAQTFELRKHIFAVRNELKAGWSEHIYHHALERALRANDIPVLSKPRRTLTHRDAEIHVFEPDIIAWNEIILELKVLPYQPQFASGHYAQIIHYLKFFQMDLGLLVNFAPTRVHSKRVIWKEPELDVMEDYRDNLSSLTSSQRVLFQRLHSILLDIARQHGLGYTDSIYRKLVEVELHYQQIGAQSEIEVQAKWREKSLAFHKTPFMLIDNQILVHICSLPGFPPVYEFARTKTYLESLGLEFALLVNFGHRQLQIYGVSKD